MKNNINKILILLFITLGLGFSQDNYSINFDFMSGYAVSNVSSESIDPEDIASSCKLSIKRPLVSSIPIF